MSTLNDVIKNTINMKENYVMKEEKKVERMTLCRKIKLIPVGDKEEINRVYQYIREGQYAQYQACNLLMGQLASEFYRCGRDLKNEEFIEIRKEIMKNSNPLFEKIALPKGLDLLSNIIRKVNSDFNIAIKNGLARGERSITNYKRTNALFTRGRSISFYHEYESYQEFLDNINSKDLAVYIKWVNKIAFKVVFGNPHKSKELRSVVQNIFEENYKVQESSIEVKDKSIILNLSISIPKKIRELDESVVVGVNLGLNTPAMCSLNNDPYTYEAIGNKDDFLRVRVKIQEQRKRLSKSLKYTSGGHGRKKKLKKLETLKKSEAHFSDTYCHMISKRIVDFALKNNAKYINLENLSGYDASEFILRNWGYNKIEQFTTYKAAMYGIITRNINPAYNGQICSVCGHWNHGPRKKVFECSNPDCISHQMYVHGLNDDFNTSRNVAMSELFMENQMITEDKMREARKYYGIEEEFQQLKQKEASENSK